MFECLFGWNVHLSMSNSSRWRIKLMCCVWMTTLIWSHYSWLSVNSEQECQTFCLSLDHFGIFVIRRNVRLGSLAGSYALAMYVLLHALIFFTGSQCEYCIHCTYYCFVPMELWIWYTQFSSNSESIVFSTLAVVSWSKIAGDKLNKYDENDNGKKVVAIEWRSVGWGGVMRVHCCYSYVYLCDKRKVALNVDPVPVK